MSDVDPAVEAAMTAFNNTPPDVGPDHWSHRPRVIAAIAAYKATRPAEASATFDALESLSERFPSLNGYYARATGGADLPRFVERLATELAARPAVDEAMVERFAANGIDPVWLTAAGAKSVLREMEHFLSDPTTGLVNGISKAHLRHWHAALTAAMEG